MNRLEAVAKSMDVPLPLSGVVTELFDGVYELGVLSSQVVDLLGPLLNKLSERSISILDVGAAKGAVGMSLLKRYPKVKMTFLDLHEGFLSQTKDAIRQEGLEERSTVVCKSVAEGLPAGQDIVLYFSMGELLGDLADTLGALRQGAQAPSYIALDYALLKTTEGSEPTHDNVLTDDAFQRILSKCGARVVGRILLDTPEYFAWLNDTMKTIATNALNLAEVHPQLCDELALFVASQNEDFASSVDMLVESHIYLIEFDTPS